MKVTGFTMSVLVMTISLIKSATFADSINWPKQIAVVSIAPLLVIIAIYGSFGLTRRSLIQLSLLGICVVNQLIYFFFEGVPSHQKIWGQIDSSNGAITITSLILTAMAFSVFKNKVVLINIMLFSLFLCGITFSILNLSKLLDPLDFYGNTNIVSFMFAIAFVSGLRFIFDQRLGIKSKFLSIVGILITSVSLFGMEDFQGKVLAVLGTLVILIYTLVKNAKLRTFFYSLLLLASLSSFAIFSGWVQFMASYTQETLQLRIMFWRTSLKMARENLLFGVGADNYQSAFRKYADTGTLETIGRLPSPDNAHNYFLHLLATLGLFGALSIILPFLLAFYVVFSERGIQKSFEEVVARIVFLLIWLDLGISVSNVSITVLGMAFLGIILGCEDTSSIGEVKSRIRILFLSPIFFVFAFGLFLFALDSTKVDREILKLEMMPINLDSSTEITIRVKELVAIANNSKILNSESAVIALDLEALEASCLKILEGC